MAFAYGIAVFSGVDNASFTWVPLPGNSALTSNPPKVLAKTEIPIDGGLIVANMQGQPTNVGGTIQASAPFNGFVIVLGMD